MTQATVKPITPRALLGEGPYWEDKDKCLLYVDLTLGKLHRYFYESGRIQNLDLESTGSGKTASFVIPVKGFNHEYVVGMGQTLAAVRWNPTEPDSQLKRAIPLVSVDSHDKTTRFNDAKCDPEGRLFAGTMDLATLTTELIPYKGTLYNFDSNLKVQPLLEKASLSNGLAWNSTATTLYYNDTYDRKTYVFDYNRATGAISNKRVLLDFAAPPGIQGSPDGMCIDSSEKLWIACYGGYQVICVDPSRGRVIKSISIPAKFVTSCCWGGPDYATLFVTTASHDHSPEQLNSYPDSGKTFSVDGLDERGLPAVEYKVDPMFWVK